MARKKKKSASNKTLPAGARVIKTSPEGIRLTGAYKSAIPKEVLDQLKSKSKEVIIQDEHLRYLVGGSFEQVKNPEILKSKTEPDEVPKKEDKSALKSEDE